MKCITNNKSRSVEEEMMITENDILKYTANRAQGVRALHNYYKNRGGYETFAEWKKKNPNHPGNKYPFPENEYMMVLRFYFDYFVEKYGDGRALTKLDF